MYYLECGIHVDCKDAIVHAVRRTLFDCDLLLTVWKFRIILYVGNCVLRFPTSLRPVQRFARSEYNHEKGRLIKRLTAKQTFQLSQ